MATLDFSYQEQERLDIYTQFPTQYDEQQQHQPNQDLNTPTNEELDRELDELLSLMDTPENELDLDNSLTATAVNLEWVDPTELVANSPRFDYRYQRKETRDYTYQSTVNSGFDYSSSSGARNYNYQTDCYRILEWSSRKTTSLIQ